MSSRSRFIELRADISEREALSLLSVEPLPPPLRFVERSSHGVVIEYDSCRDVDHVLDVSSGKLQLNGAHVEIVRHHRRRHRSRSRSRHRSRSRSRSRSGSRRRRRRRHRNSRSHSRSHSRSPPRHRHSRSTLCVSGLPPGTDQDTIRAAFAAFVPVAAVHPLSSSTAEVEFFTPAEARVALLNSASLTVGNQRLTVELLGGSQQVPRPAHLPPSFTLDSSSGLFFDASSRLFYNPATDLYRHADTQALYRWNPAQGAYEHAASDPLPDAAPAGSDASPNEPNPAGSSATAPIAFAVMTKKRQASRNIKRWNKRKRSPPAEPVGPAAASAPTAPAKTSPPPAAAAAPPASNPIAHLPSKLLQPFEYVDVEHNACLLCQRKFRSTEHLRKHESLSRLHAKNSQVNEARLLEHDRRERDRKRRPQPRRPSRLQVEAERRCKTSARRYVRLDRARQIILNSSSPEPQAKALDHSNRGFQLLKAAGWQEGQGLGRDSQGRTQPVTRVKQRGRAGLGASTSSRGKLG